MIQIQKVLKQAKTTFSSNSEDITPHLNELCDLMNNVTAEDVNLDLSFIGAETEKEGKEYAPISYIDIYEDKDLSLGIFILKPNAILPLHNHPEMYGLIKVLCGKVTVDSFSINTPKTLEADKVLSANHFLDIQTSGSSFHSDHNDSEEAQSLVEYKTVGTSTQSDTFQAVSNFVKPSSSILELESIAVSPIFVDAACEAKLNMMEASTSTSTLDTTDNLRIVDHTMQTEFDEMYPNFLNTPTKTNSDTGAAQMIHKTGYSFGIPLRRVVSAEFIARDIVDKSSKPCILTPLEKNIHEIRSMQEPAAFLDILAPPYNTEIPNVGPRYCTYFGNLGTVLDNVFLLEQIKIPAFYWTDSKPYLGPDPTINVD